MMDNIYVIEWYDNGVGDAYETMDAAQKAVLKLYLKEIAPKMIERSEIDTIIEDIRTLIEHNYIEDYAWVITSILHKEEIDGDLCY